MRRTTAFCGRVIISANRSAFSFSRIALTMEEEEEEERRGKRKGWRRGWMIAGKGEGKGKKEAQQVIVVETLNLESVQRQRIETPTSPLTHILPTRY